VAEAMLVGDGRPYCAALLWLEGEANPAALAALEAGIAVINEEIAHPEQIRRWAVLEGGLTVEDGSLTGSMKVKRDVVSARLTGEIEALYRGEALPAMRLGGVK
jgi:long-chain acyl-CoA synthetase